jgi:hypothetical protein
MRLAILGTDLDVVALVAAALSRGHVPVWLADLREEDATAFRAVAPAISTEANWEAVLDHGLADAVIVGTGTTGEPGRLERLKRLVADAVPTLTTYPISASVLPHFELDMVRNEVHGVLHHYNPIMDTAAVDRIAGWLRAGHDVIGRIRQLAWERHLSDLSTTLVHQALARDTEALLRMVDVVPKVSAFGAQSDSERFNTLHVQMGTTSEVVITWAITPTDRPSGVRLMLIGEHGKLSINVEEGAGGRSSWQIEDDGHDLGGADAAGAAVDRLAKAVASTDRDDPERSTWHHATRAMEIVDAVQLSLQRGRTIEILHQQLTEQLAFRGVMSAFGCGLLLFGVLILIVVSVLGGTIGISLVEWWPAGLAALLLFFLLLQLVPHTRRRR